MINYSVLGRYEFVSGNSDKFYSIKYIKEDEYEIMYGKNYHPPLSIYTVNEVVALKKIKEKINKGYKHVDTNVDDYHKKAWINMNKKTLDSILPEKDEKQKIRIKL